MSTRGWFGYWYLASTGHARKMKYKVSTIRPTTWKNTKLPHFQTKIEKMLNTLIVTTDMPKEISYKPGKLIC